MNYAYYLKKYINLLKARNVTGLLLSFKNLRIFFTNPNISDSER